MARRKSGGGGKGGMYSERSFTIATGNDQVLIVDGTRVDDVRVYEDGIVPTVISRYGTGGGNVPMVQKPNETTVRRLTPTECERLQGFPDGWTDGQADSNRYKQMGNAVAVPVVEWIIGRMVEEIS